MIRRKSNWLLMRIGRGLGKKYYNTGNCVGIQILGEFNMVIFGSS